MIRKAEKQDLEQIAEIWLDTNKKAHDFIPGSYWQNNLEPVRGMLAQAELYVYEENGEILGFVGMDGNYLAGIFVRETQQSRGIGKKLIQEMKQRKQRLTLRVYEKNQKAIAFYEREGFVKNGQGMDEETKEAEYEMSWRA